MLIIGIDNGTTGSITALDVAMDTSVSIALSINMPVKEELDYTKEAKHITRVVLDGLVHELRELITSHDTLNIRAVIERPMINPGRFKQSILAARAFEATIIALELLGIAYRVVDSRVWQKALLPSGLKGIELKKAAVQFVHKTFPKLDRSKDQDGRADSVCLAYYGVRHL